MNNRGLILGLTASPLVIALALLLLVVTFDDNSSTSRAQLAAATMRTGAGAVPAQYAGLIDAAAAACDEVDLPAVVLAAQLKAESGFDPHADSGQAQGIAQFAPGTWASSGVDGNGDGKKDVWDPADAIPAQGAMMCKLLKTAIKHPDYDGTPIELALAGYNAGWGRVEEFRGVPPHSFAAGQTYHYVKTVMAYVDQLSQPLVDADLPAAAPESILTAITWAEAQEGGWYHLGGDCTAAHGTNPQHRCDCSSLVQQAYKAAGISIPRTTYQQVTVGHRVDIDHPQPGDLIFNPGKDGSDAAPGHVGMYIGGGQLIEAPHTGARTRVVAYSTWRDTTSNSLRISAVVRVVDW